MERFTGYVQSAIAAGSSGGVTFEASFEVINVKWIAAVKMERREYPCRNHLLCHPDGETMLLSRPGLAVASELLHSIVRVIGGSPSPSADNDKDDVTVLRAPNEKYFLRDHGLVRSVPDSDTMACLNLSAGGKLAMKAVTASELADLPAVVTPLPSRKRGTVLAGENTPGVAWAMEEDCTRRYVGPGEAKSVMEMDLEDIPTA